MRRCSALLLVLLPLAAACAGDSGSRPEDGFAVTDSAGVELVRNGRVGRWGPAAPHLEEVVRIGVVDGPDHVMFHDIRSLAVHADGTVFVGNNRTATVRVFRADGTFLTEFGGRGSGPGEYTMVNVVWLAGDDVAITDWQIGGRTGIYSRDGELRHFWSSTRPDGARVTPVALTPAGWLATLHPRYAPPVGRPGEAVEQPSRLYRFDPADNAVAEPLHQLPAGVLYITPAGSLDWPLFQPRRQLGFDGSGNVFTSHGEPYRIDVHDADGRHVRGVSRVHDPVPISDRDIAQLKALVAQHYDSLAQSWPQDVRAEAEQLRARIDVQRAFDPRPALPPLGRLLVSPDGSFWIERSDVLEPARVEYERYFRGLEATRASTWDLFDADGAFLTTVELPARFHPHAIRGVEVTGVERGEFDVEYVVTYRAVPATR